MWRLCGCVRRSAGLSHVKGGILSLSCLAACVEYEGKGQVSAESKARFGKEFPTENLKTILAKKPEYAERAFVIERTSFRPQIKLPKPQAPKPKAKSQNPKFLFSSSVLSAVQISTSSLLRPDMALDPGRELGHALAVSAFITGTDTDVGKTYVTRLILESLRQSGIDAVGYKPVACGNHADATILAAASGNLSRDEVNPVFLKPALAPLVAGILENRCVTLAELMLGYDHLAARHASVFVEGVGGWEVPLAPGLRVADLAAALALPVIVVAANRLGCLNHVLLTVNAIRARGLTCAGIILNQLEDEMDTAMITNKGVLAGLAGVPLLAHLIYGQDFLEADELRQFV